MRSAAVVLTSGQRGDRRWVLEIVDESPSPPLLQIREPGVPFGRGASGWSLWDQSRLYVDQAHLGDSPAPGRKVLFGAASAQAASITFESAEGGQISTATLPAGPDWDRTFFVLWPDGTLSGVVTARDERGEVLDSRRVRDRYQPREDVPELIKLAEGADATGKWMFFAGERAGNLAVRYGWADGASAGWEGPTDIERKLKLSSLMGADGEPQLAAGLAAKEIAKVLVMLNTRREIPASLIEATELPTNFFIATIPAGEDPDAVSGFDHRGREVAREKIGEMAARLRGFEQEPRGRRTD
jgi:hypothetical protein